MLTPLDLGAVLSLTRASTRTYFDRHGVLREAPADTPATSHAPATGAPLGLIVEGATTNLLLQSADLSDPVWTLTDAAITATGMRQGIAMYRVAALGATGSTPRVQQPITPAVTRYTASFFARPGSDGLIKAAIATGSGAEIAGVSGTLVLAYNHDAGQFTALDPALTARAHVIGPDLFRIEVTFEVTAAPAGAAVWIHLMARLGASDGAGDWGEFGGIQIEEGEAATSYIITGTVSATRTAETASVDLGGVDLSAFTLVAVGRPGPRAQNGTNAAVFAALRNSAEGLDHLSLAVAGGAGYFRRALLRNAAGVLDEITEPAVLIAPGERSAMAVRVASGQMRLVIDGMLVGDTAAPHPVPALDTLDVGARAGGRHLNGTLERLLIYPEALGIAEMQDLTV